MLLPKRRILSTVSSLTAVVVLLSACGSSESSTDTVSPSGKTSRSADAAPTSPSATSRSASFLDETILAEPSPARSADAVDERWRKAEAGSGGSAGLDEARRTTARLRAQIAKENEAVGLGAFSCPLTAREITSAAGEPMVKNAEDALQCGFVQRDLIDTLKDDPSGLKRQFRVALTRAAGSTVDGYVERSQDACAAIMGVGKSVSERKYDPAAVSLACSTPPDSDVGASNAWDLVYPMPETKAVWSMSVSSFALDGKSSTEVARIGRRLVRALGR